MQNERNFKLAVRLNEFNDAGWRKQHLEESSRTNFNVFVKLLQVSTNNKRDEIVFLVLMVQFSDVV